MKKVAKKIHWIRIGLGLLISLGIAGCAAPRPPSAPPVRIPTVQLEAFDQGMKAYEERDYKKAVEQFQTVIQRFPGSPLLEEAQWMIGKSYESQNEFERALREYESFVANFPKSTHRYEARLRIDFLEDILKRKEGKRIIQRYVGVIVSGDPKGAVGGWEKAFGNIRIKGPRVVIIQGYGPNGVYFKTSQAPVIRETLPDAVAAAHRAGYRIWVRIPERHLPWFKVPGEERDLRYDPVQKRLVPSDALDFFNPATLDRLVQFNLDLAATGVDGFVIDEDPLIGPWEGFSPGGRAAFALDFGESLEPGRLFPISPSAGRTVSPPESSGTPLFWKWSGWKNRQVLGHLAKVIKAVQDRNPSVDWVRVVPMSAVTQPQLALARSGIDLLEEKSRGFDYFAIASPGESGSGNPFGVVDRMVNLIGDPKRVMVIIPMKRLNWATAHLNDFQGTGLLVSTEPGGGRTP